MKLSLVARAAVRKAVFAHEKWSSWSLANGIPASKLTADTMLMLCAMWGINIEEIARKAEEDFGFGKRDEPAPARVNRGWRKRAWSPVEEGEELSADEAMALDAIIRAYAGINAFLQSLRDQLLVKQIPLTKRQLIAARRVLAREKAEEGAKPKQWAGIDIVSPEPAVAQPDAPKPVALDAGMLINDLAKLIVPIIDDKIRQAIEKLAIPQAPAIKVNKPDGHRHPLFAEILALAAQGENVMLKGPAGCGKTVTSKHVAIAMGKAFASISGSAGVSEAQLVGRLLPTGKGGKFKYHASPFVKAYEEGSAFLFDEIDAFDPNCLLTANMATANDGFEVEARSASGLETFVARHPETILLAAANTFGTGADAMYVGRSQLDAATLDRWYILEMDYDKAFEKTLAPSHVVDWVWQVRETITRRKYRRLMTTRAIQRAVKGLDAGRAWPVVQKDLLAGWTPDERASIAF